jgi:hypothetical protein
MKQIKIRLLSGLVTLLLIGCGGGGGGSSGESDINVSEIIENKPFYRVVSDTRYLEELFDGNGSLYEDTYFITHELDTNRTIHYEIDDPYVTIAYSDGAIRCRVEDNNLSVIFWCLTVGASGAESPTVRWKKLDDAIANPES